MADNYYTQLQVLPGASVEDIKRAWQRETIFWQNRARNAEEKALSEGAEQQVQELDRIKTVLTDPQRRAQYDKTLAVDQPKQVPDPIAQPLFREPGPGSGYRNDPQDDQRWARVTRPRWIKRRHPVLTVFLLLVAIDGFISAGGVYGQKSENQAENAVLGVIALLIAVYFSKAFRRR